MAQSRDGSGATRRAIFAGATAAAAAVATQAAAQARAAGPVILTSWEFGPGANATGFPILDRGGSALDAVEAAINQVELSGNFAVGAGGTPNEIGETTLDAMIMWGPTHDVGAVGCLKRVKRAVSVARAVMEKTQHSLIVGDDATRFAVRTGFEETSLTSLASQKFWEEWAAKGEKSSAWNPEPIQRPQGVGGHDTVGSMAIDRNGNLCVGCSTNGRNFKLPGRVGDSPIAGAGAYCDNDVGAAIATGNGDVMMRFLPTYHAIELLRAGKSPAEAAQGALQRIAAKGYRIDGAVLVLARDGRHGAAKLGWRDNPLTYSVQNAQGPQTFTVAPVG